MNVLTELSRDRNVDSVSQSTVFDETLVTAVASDPRLVSPVEQPTSKNIRETETSSPL